MKKKTSITKSEAVLSTAKKTAAKKSAIKASSKAVAMAVKEPAKPLSEPKPKVAKAAKRSTVNKQKRDLAEVVNEVDIARAAFLNWCQRRDRGWPDDALADWALAEQQLRVRHA
ncbi:MAG: hypothetical protein RLZZ224_355 [Verrucomicrobiota bacterium]